MEFNGFTGTDFDFFKKKDKMAKEEYEKIRNEVKLHFRGLCYEIQKIYHKKTNGVFYLDKEFHNFNRRSREISAEHQNIENGFNLIFQLNAECLGIVLNFTGHDKAGAEDVASRLKNKKNTIWQYLSSNKFMMMSAEFPQKNKKNTSLKLTSLDISNKNYDTFIDFINNNISKEKYECRLSIGYTFPKSECIKQGKNFKNTAYEAAVSMMNLEKELNDN